MTKESTDNAPHLFTRAVQLHQQGKLDDAQGLYRRILASDPRHFHALHMLGVSLCQQKRLPQGLKWLSKALEINPDSPEARRNRQTALRDFEQSAEVKNALHEIMTRTREGRYQEAEQLCHALLEKAGESFVATHSLALVHLQQGRHPEAEQWLRKALAISPKSATAWSNLGVVLAETHRDQEALECYDRALALKPDYAEALNNRSVPLRGLYRYEEALESIDRALVIHPTYPAALQNLANTLRKCNRHQEALAVCERLLKIQPHHPEALINQAICHLSLGNFATGWEKYESRRTGQTHLAERQFAEPLWLGREDLSGKTILLHAEQGIGDALQFCRYVPMVAALGATVIVEAPDTLAELFQGLGGVHQCVSEGDTLPDFDYQCPLLSLPLAFGTTLETIPATTPYLSVAPERYARWEAKLASIKGPRVGIAWSGNRDHEDDRNRSIALARMRSHLPAESEFICLQNEIRAEDQAVLPLSKLHLFTADLTDFAETAALIQNLDLVITVDTSVAHLAGALNKPLWVLLPYSADWRWLRNRPDSPWYPSARLFRQPQPGDWESVIAEVMCRLQELPASA